LKVKPIKPFEAEPWLLQKHYAKRLPQIIYAFGLYDPDLIGVVTYGLPASPNLCMGICGVPYKDIVIELNRLCINDGVPNGASKLVSESLKMLPKPSIVVSYADTDQGHVGYVYQATNFLYTGLSAIRVDWQIKGLENKHARHMGKTLEQIKREHGDDFYYKQRSRKHRYIYFVGSKKDKKILLNALKYPINNYPKGDTKRYDSGGNVATQGMLF